MGKLRNAKDYRQKENLETISNAKPGFYKWYANFEDFNYLVNKLGSSFNDVSSFVEKKDDMYCIYIGIAVKESIRARINWHINQHHTKSAVKHGFLSTFRKSISSIVCKDQYNEDCTNQFIDKLKVECFESENTIKSQEAKTELHSIEKEALKKNLYILNIQENYHPAANEIKKQLKHLRKISK